MVAFFRIIFSACAFILQASLSGMFEIYTYRFSNLNTHNPSQSPASANPVLAPVPAEQLRTFRSRQSSQIVGLFDLNKVHPECRTQCQAASDIVSICKDDACVCDNKENEALSSCLTCGFTTPQSDIEREAASRNAVNFFLDICNSSIDDEGGNNGENTDPVNAANTQVTDATGSDNLAKKNGAVRPGAMNIGALAVTILAAIFT
ncbi:hypothetical protein FPV67DRAFT_706455 [Lyophyllum atratum]|nr:hypothetical protein FPV67DRAFT_706455 [Lyophyllum atratum]